MLSTRYDNSVHKNLLKLDAHVDIEVTFMTEERKGVLGYDKLVSLEKAHSGDLNGAFFAIFTEQPELGKEDYKSAKELVLKKFKSIHDSVNKYKGDVELALYSDDVLKIYKNKKIAALIGVENAYPIGDNLENIDEFYNLGARYITLSHVGFNQLCDSNVPKWGIENKHNGLSVFGKEAVRKMNKLGMIVDVAHTHKKTIEDVVKITKAPIIASHTAMSGLYKFNRNIDDDSLRAIKETGGVVNVVALNDSLKPETEERKEAVKKLRIEFKMPTDYFEWVFYLMKQPDEIQAEYKKRLAKVDEIYPSTGINDYIEHIEHAIKIIGIDHVGIGTDFFDSNFSPKGLEDARKLPRISEELLKKGYSQNDLQKIWSGNILRVLKNVEEAADR